LVEGSRSAEPTDQVVDFFGDGVENVPARRAGGHGSVIGGENGNLPLPSFGKAPRYEIGPLAVKFRELLFMPGQKLLPFRLAIATLYDGPAKMLPGVLRNQKRRLFGPAQIFLGGFDLVGPEGRAVGLEGVLLVGTAVADMGVDDDQGRPPRVVSRRFNGSFESRKVVAVFNVLHVPPVGLEALAHILGKGDFGGGGQ